MGLRTVPTGAVVLVTLTTPLVAVDGTVARSCVADTNVLAVAAMPLSCTLELLVNPTPLIVTTVPYGPLAGLTAVIDSAWAAPCLPTHSLSCYGPAAG
ncbi:MAG: hypothetical protein QOJ89_2548 [bacterium]